MDTAGDHRGYFAPKYGSKVPTMMSGHVRSTEAGARPNSLTRGSSAQGWFHFCIVNFRQAGVPGPAACGELVSYYVMPRARAHPGEPGRPGRAPA